jgi:hypothetical protein
VYLFVSPSHTGSVVVLIGSFGFYVLLLLVPRGFVVAITIQQLDNISNIMY